MKKLLTILTLFVCVGSYAQVDSTTYYNEIETRVKAGRFKRDSLAQQFREIGNWAYQFKGHFADSAAVVAAHPGPVQGEFASVGNGNWFVVNSSLEWVGVAGGGGGGSGATDGVTLDGDGGGTPYFIKLLGVTAGEIASNAVDSTKILKDAVRSGEILNGTIALVDMGANSVDSTKIADGGVDNEDLEDVNQDVIIGRNDPGAGPRESLTAAEVKTLLAIGLDDLSDVTLTAPATNSTLIYDGADFIDGFITGASITDGTVDEVDIATDAITNVKLATGAVDTDELAANAVTLLRY